MIEKLYSDFDSDITIRSEVAKTFPESQLDFSKISRTEGVESTSKAVEEIVVLNHEKKRVNAVMVGVEPTFLTFSKMEKHLLEGSSFLVKNDKEFGIIGASLLDKLGGFIPERVGHEEITIFAPKRDAKVRVGSNPFTTRRLSLAGRMNFNREVNAEKLIVPLSYARDVLNYSEDITAVYVDVKEGFDNQSVKESLQHKLGADFSVKTNYEKNELIFKTSKSEKLIVLIILLFIFILAAFNLVASLTMLFVEKKENVDTMISFGADKKTVFQIFFFEGVLIAGKGIVIGLALGYSICLAQLKWALLTMPNSGGEAFPIKLSLVDGLLILSLVSLLSFLFSYLPVRFLIKKNFGHLHF
ncbi:MAG: ABC transporter permease [Crocinitomicaceae bacterium]|nr:MAG: ABC transporter permease [Crocinitomicaceae bacterium]